MAERVSWLIWFKEVAIMHSHLRDDFDLEGRQSSKGSMKMLTSALDALTLYSYFYFT